MSVSVNLFAIIGIVHMSKLNVLHHSHTYMAYQENNQMFKQTWWALKDCALHWPNLEKKKKTKNKKKKTIMQQEFW